MSSDYEGIGLRFNQMGLSSLRALLNEDKEFEDEFTAKSAIAKLKEERTYCNAFGFTDSYYVDLTIINPNNKPENNCNIQINAAIDLIKGLESNADLRFNFTIRKANVNGINKHFLGSNESSSKRQKGSFQLAFESVDEKSALKLAQVMSSSKCEVSMVVKKSDLMSLLEKQADGTSKCKLDQYNTVFSFSVCIVERKKYQQVDLDELRKKVKALANDEKSIEIKVNS